MLLAIGHVTSSEYSVRSALILKQYFLDIIDISDKCKVCAFNIIELSEFDEQLAFYTLYVVRTIETCAI